MECSRFAGKTVSKRRVESPKSFDQDVRSSINIYQKAPDSLLTYQISSWFFCFFFLSYHPLIHSSDTYWIQSNEGIFPRRKGKRKSNIKGEEPWNLLSFVLFGKIYWKEKPINKMSKNTWPIIEKSENKSSIYKKKQRIMWKMKHKVKKKMRKETIYKRKRENQPEDLGK